MSKGSIIYSVNGKRVSRHKFLAGSPPEGGLPMIGAYSEARPLESLALSCHPKQAEEYNAASRRLGLTGIGWDRRGRCHITSRQDRARWLRVNGMHDNDGGYGDG